MLPEHTYNLGSSCRDLVALADPGERWEFPKSLAEKMMMDEFWEKAVPARGARALVPETVAAHIQGCLGAGVDVPVPEGVVELFREGKDGKRSEASSPPAPTLRKSLKRQGYERDCLKHPPNAKW